MMLSRISRGSESNILGSGLSGDEKIEEETEKSRAICLLIMISLSIFAELPNI
jgi:hypothetical protein